MNALIVIVAILNALFAAGSCQIDTITPFTGEGTIRWQGYPAGGYKLVPPVGAKCKLSGMVFDCGGKWQKLNAYYPAPN